MAVSEAKYKACDNFYHKLNTKAWQKIFRDLLDQEKIELEIQAT